MMRRYYIMCAMLAVMVLANCSEDEVALDGSSIEIAVNDAPFEWTRAEDVETRSKFLRNFGLGYSYDAVRGEYCNWKDIRCQVVSRHQCEVMQGQTGEMVLGTNTAMSVQVDSKFEYSFRDYVANVSLYLDEEADLGLYHGTKRKRQFFIEDGYQEKFYYTLDKRIALLNTYLSEAAVLSLFRSGRHNVLTTSFVNAVLHLSETDDSNIAAVDSFINVWGTHVITESWLGGKLRVDLMNELWRYKDEASLVEYTYEQFLTAVEEHQREGTTDAYRWLEDSRLNITAWGGDQSTLTDLLGEYHADGSHTFSLDGIKAWSESLRYDPVNELNSNVEMIDMRLIPIWIFVEAIDPHSALRVQAAVTQDAGMQQALLGNVNFFNAAFPIRYPQASSLWHDPQGTWQQVVRTDSNGEPMVVNIASVGRYVATVCHETINGVKFWVCYPVYEGRVNLACGLGVAEQNNEVYQVQWLNGKPTVIPNPMEAHDGMFYITDGAVGVRPAEGIRYEEGHPMAYMAYRGGVQPNGSYDISNLLPVMKQGDQFVITSPAKMDDIVGWTLTDEQDGHYTYTRNSNYYYIYNPNEMRYE